MYKIREEKNTIRIPPARLNEEYNELVKNLTCSTFEGTLSEDGGYVLCIVDVEASGDGRIVHGDGGIYQDITFRSVLFSPDIHEVFKGEVVETLKFGSFVRIGPLDGLVHISQMINDQINFDIGNQRFVGKDSKRDIKINDHVISRIVAITPNETSPRETKIGLTMRQTGLGKEEWMEEDRKAKLEAPVKDSTEKGGK